MIVWCLYETSGSTHQAQLRAYVDYVRIFTWGIAGALGFSQGRAAISGMGLALTPKTPTTTAPSPPATPPTTMTPTDQHVAPPKTP